MKFILYYFNKTPIHIAVEKTNITIIKLLLSNKQLDINAKSIHNITINIVLETFI